MRRRDFLTASLALPLLPYARPTTPAPPVYYGLDLASATDEFALVRVTLSADDTVFVEQLHWTLDEIARCFAVPRAAMESGLWKT